jgi:hypothetical protein
VVNGPSIAWLCIHANWKMPEVVDQYMHYESARDEYVGRSVMVDFAFGRGLQRAVLSLTLVNLKRLRRRRGTRSWTNGYKVECRSLAAQKLFSSSNPALHHLFFTCISWMKTPMITMHSAFLPLGLKQFVLHVVLSQDSLVTRLKTLHSSLGSPQMFCT